MCLGLAMLYNELGICTALRTKLHFGTAVFGCVFPLCRALRCYFNVFWHCVLPSVTVLLQCALGGVFATEHGGGGGKTNSFERKRGMEAGAKTPLFNDSEEFV